MGLIDQPLKNTMKRNTRKRLIVNINLVFMLAFKPLKEKRKDPLGQYI